MTLSSKLNRSLFLSLGLILIMSACSSSQTKDSDEGDDADSASKSVSDPGSGDSAKTDPLPDANTEVPGGPGTVASPGPALDAGLAPLPAPAETPVDVTASNTLPPPADANTVTPTPAVVAAAPAASGASDSSTGGASGTYQVKRGDTLMKIAFQTTGDVFKWKEIYEMNKDQISHPNSLQTGMTLKISGSGNAEESHPSGEKYLIQKGDTLGKISSTLYGTPAKWKKLWKHNKGLIKNPNQIFSGFYLYYTPSSESPTHTEMTQKTSPAADTTASNSGASDAVAPQPVVAAAPPAPANGASGGNLSGLSNALSAATPN